MIRAVVAVVVVAAMASVARADAPTGYRCGDGKPDVGTGCTCPAGKRSTIDSSGVAKCVASSSPGSSFRPEVTPECRKDATACAKAADDLRGDDTAIKWNLEAGCSRDDADSCARLVGYTKEPAAGKLRERACLLGSEDACIDYGGTLDLKKVPAARERFQAACAKDRCAGMGMLFELGLGVEKNPARAGDYYARGCKQRIAACERAARMYVNAPDAARDKLYAPVARLCPVDETWCVLFAKLTREGRGTARDPAKAFAMFEKLCRVEGQQKYDQPGACVALGEMLVAGEGTSANAERARRVFEMTCTASRYPSQGQACERLADLYDRGIGVAMDFDKATEYAIAACQQQGDGQCMDLIARYRDSHPKRALELARILCKRTDQQACYLVKQLEAKLGAAP